MASYRITLLAGDGIGPEITAIAVKLLGRVAQQFNFQLDFD
ncbi:MAG TPA: 3-isopropylmalate dehydrogenase, partial [Synechococcales bacterium UBA8138]|nr:3-isopropylmalate dehydrogenase [Synechococcales bacterium UBA8138]